MLNSFFCLSKILDGFLLVEHRLSLGFNVHFEKLTDQPEK